MYEELGSAQMCWMYWLGPYLGHLSLSLPSAWSGLKWVGRNQFRYLIHQTVWNDRRNVNKNASKLKFKLRIINWRLKKENLSRHVTTVCLNQRGLLNGAVVSLFLDFWGSKWLLYNPTTRVKLLLQSTKAKLDAHDLMFWLAITPLIITLLVSLGLKIKSVLKSSGSSQSTGWRQIGEIMYASTVRESLKRGP